MTPIDAPQPHWSRTPGIYKQFACEKVRSAQKLFAIKKMAAQGMSIKQITGAVFSSSREMADRIVPVKDTAQKHVIEHVIALSTETDNTTNNTCLPEVGFLSSSSGPCWADFSSKKSKLGTLESLFCFSVLEMEEKTF